MPETTPPICDYEGSAYRTEFWGANREYEDAVERIALRRLLPPTGERLIEIGVGYGRLVGLYGGYDQVVFCDYALSQLRQAQEIWGTTGDNGSPRYVYVAADFYRLPFASGLFDTVTMVRVLHHAADVPAVFQGIARILSPTGTLVLEFANKRNLKAILRYLARRQSWSPFDQAPVEFVPLNFDFHPAWIQAQLTAVGLAVEARRTVSHFRWDVLKKLLPTPWLVALDRLCQPTGAWWQLTPSVFVRCRPQGNDQGQGNDHGPAPSQAPPQRAFFRCTVCGSTLLVDEGDALSCTDCGARFAIQDGIYNFLQTASRHRDLSTTAGAAK